MKGIYKPKPPFPSIAVISSRSSLVNGIYKSLLPIFTAFNGVTGMQWRASRVQQVHKHALGLTVYTKLTLSC